MGRFVVCHINGMYGIIEATFVSSCVSIVSSIILIIWERVQYSHLVTTPAEKPIAQHLSNCIVMLAIADMIASLGFGISVVNAYPHVCFVQAQLIEVGALSSAFWTSMFHLVYGCCRHGAEGLISTAYRTMDIDTLAYLLGCIVFCVRLCEFRTNFVHISCYKYLSPVPNQSLSKRKPSAPCSTGKQQIVFVDVYFLLVHSINCRDNPN